MTASGEAPAIGTEPGTPARPAPAAIGGFEHGEAIGILACADPAEVKRAAEGVLSMVGPVEVVLNRTGLVMLPCRDTAGGAAFHLGEVLVAEAHVRLTEHGTEGYGACVGRDVEGALAVAVLDAAAEAGIGVASLTALLQTQAAALAEADRERLRRVEATRVRMETF